MKRALVLLCVMGLALGASAGLTTDPHRGFYFVGVEIVPHSAMALPYLTLGYDAGWLVSGVGFNSPLTLGVGTGQPRLGWIMAFVAPAFEISPMLRGYGGVAFWLHLVNYAAAGGRWSTWAGVNWRAGQMSVAGWGVEASVYAKGHLPFEIPAGAPWLGAWFTFGATIGIAPPAGP